MQFTLHQDDDIESRMNKYLCLPSMAAPTKEPALVLPPPGRPVLTVLTMNTAAVRGTVPKIFEQQSVDARLERRKANAGAMIKAAFNGASARRLSQKMAKMQEQGEVWRRAHTAAARGVVWRARRQVTTTAGSVGLPKRPSPNRLVPKAPMGESPHKDWQPQNHKQSSAARGTWGFADCVRGGIEIAHAISEAAGSKEAAGFQEVATHLYKQALENKQASKNKDEDKSSCCLQFTYTSSSQKEFSVRTRF